MKKIIMMLAPIAATLTGCSQISPQGEFRTGYFIDAPVTGLYYTTSSGMSGVTNKGAYQYKQGDTVTFYLGNNEQAMPLTKVSPQPVVTPYSSTTTPSRTVNLTRLLLSLDTEPENHEEILLASQLLEQPEFQEQLNSLDFNNLEQTSQALNISLVSIETAVNHLAESHKYIEQNFSSEDIIYSPLNKTYIYASVKRRDYAGRLCYFDTARADEVDYYGPIGLVEFTMNSDGIIMHPSIGDYFGSDDGTLSSCELDISHRTYESEFEPWQVFEGIPGMIGCAATGCKRQQLNGYSIEDYNDGGDWKYRTVAHSFNEAVELLMETNQGLGPTANIPHDNRSELLRFIYTSQAPALIDMKGIWKMTQYRVDSLETRQQCLLITDDHIYQTGSDERDCEDLEKGDFDQDVTLQFADMWWIKNNQAKAALTQLNSAVKWYDQANSAHITSWEYLPAGKQWDSGILYRLQQKVVVDASGEEQLDTFAITELRKEKQGDSNG